MSGNSHIDSFDQLAAEIWEREGYDVATGEQSDLVARQDGETRLIETYPDGEVTASDVDEAVSRLIESANASHVTLVVGDEVPSSLRDQTEEWDVSLVDEPELRELAGSEEVDAALDGELSERPVSDHGAGDPASASTTIELDADPERQRDATASTAEESPNRDRTDVERPVDRLPGEEGASDTQVESTVQRHERRTLAREVGAVALEAVLAVLLAVALGYLLFQVAVLL